MDARELLLNLQRKIEQSGNDEAVVLIHDRTTGKNYHVAAVDRDFDANGFYLDIASGGEENETTR